MWQRLVNKRFGIMAEALRAGHTVQFKSTGRSLEPLVFSSDTCLLAPIKPGINSEHEPGDIVFCSCQPGDRMYVHLFWRVYEYTTEWGSAESCYIIGNSKEGSSKRENGWCYREHIIGKFTKPQRGNFVAVNVERSME